MIMEKNAWGIFSVQIPAIFTARLWEFPQNRCVWSFFVVCLRFFKNCLDLLFIAFCLLERYDHDSWLSSLTPRLPGRSNVIIHNEIIKIPRGRSGHEKVQVSVWEEFFSGQCLKILKKEEKKREKKHTWLISLIRLAVHNYQFWKMYTEQCSYVT